MNRSGVKKVEAVITGLPDYRPPIEQSLRCVCGLRYVVFTGAPFPFNEAAFEAARERAGQMGARFIDARETPWLVCSCGEALMFVGDAAAGVM
jgi:hypothetical protein